MYSYTLANIVRRVNKTSGRVGRSVASLSQQPFPILQDALDMENLRLSEAKATSEELLNKLETINKLCYDGGGEKGQAVHVQKNKKVLPREKLKRLFDEDSDILELSLQAGLGTEYGDIPGATTITTIGRIHSRYCMVVTNDGTMKGGTFYPITLKKSIRAQEVSRVNLLPAINLVDSGGAYLPLQSEIFPDRLHGGRGFYNQAVDGAVGIPQISLVCGSCTAGGAYIPSMCEDAAIVHKIGTMFLAGPPLVKAATSEDITAEELGGATLHCKTSGGLDYFAPTEQEGFEMVRDVVASLNVEPIELNSDSLLPAYSPKDLDVMCGVETFDKTTMLGIIARIANGSRFREFKAQYGEHLITGYAMVDRHCVGIIGNYGPISYEDGLKGAHFIQICQHRNLPIIFLQNSGSLRSYRNFMKSKSEEDRAILLRGRATMVASVACASVPKVAINVKSCHADDNYSMCGPSFMPNFIFCWPGAQASHSHNFQILELTQEEEDIEKKKTKRSGSKFHFPSQSCWYYASRSLYDGIIRPSDSRKILLQCLRIFQQTDHVKCLEKAFPIYRF